MSKHLLSLFDYTPETLADVLALADTLKQRRGSEFMADTLAGKSIAMIFSKSSTRTRVSFEVAIRELGGFAMFFDKNALQLGRGEPISDTARVLNRYVHGIVIRYHSHADVEELARYSEIPVINALTDLYHPCQIVADLQTIRERFGKLAGVRIAYFGDGASNVARSLVLGAKLAGCHLTIASPEPYQPPVTFLNEASDIGPGTVEVTTKTDEAARDAEVLYTDVWVSMGFEDQAQERLAILQPYQVDARLMQMAAANAIFMHCLPAYRGKEVSAEVIDGPASVIYDEAENRLHAQKAILCHAFSRK
ncbi:MAG: ornithine carbamoyltransferase [Lentisphaerae bacterium]|nr:MAG: ornithine carbamoyltransferase [Lentisphaerota bacterium]